MFLIVDAISLTASSFGRLTPTLFTLLSAFYLLSLPKKTTRTYWLAGFFLIFSVYNLGSLFGFSINAPWGTAGWYAAAAVLFGMIFKIQFAYRLPSPAWPREARIVLFVTAAAAVLAFGDYAVRASLAEVRYNFQNHNYESTYYSAYIPALVAITFVWGLIVLGRQALRGSGNSRFNRPALAFFVLTLLELAIPILFVLLTLGFGSRQTVNLLENSGFLLIFSLYVLFYLNTSSEPSSFIVKLVGISLVAIMSLLSILGMRAIQREEQQYNRERLEDVHVAGQLLEAAVPLERLAPSILEYVIELPGNNTDRGRVVFERSDAVQAGESLAELWTADAGLSETASTLPPAVGAPPIQKLQRSYRWIAGRPFVFFRDDSREYGFSYDNYRARIHAVALEYCLAVLASTVFMLVVFPLLFRETVTRPLRRLLGQLRRNQPDVADETTHIEGDELVALSKSFAGMLRVLKNARDRYTEYSEHIDEIERIIAGDDESQTIIHSVGDRNLVTASPAMREVIRRTHRYAEFERPILITGETGTGKELVARLIHFSNDNTANDDDQEAQTQPRDAGPFVAVNCAAVPATLWEDEIFGHVKGAFTDARNARAGRVAEAAGGSLFFDEVGELPLEMQAKLLRLLQERQYHPVGGTEMRPADCRFIFATNRDLPTMVQAGTFREDLLYRINVLHVHVPPLRERSRDIPVLVDFILKNFCEETGLAPVEPDDRALAALLTYRWPGNIRELENVLMQALAADRADPAHIGVEHLPASVREASRSAVAPVAALSSGRPAVFTAAAPDMNATPPNFDEALQSYSRALIEDALRRTNGNKTKAAEMLGMKRNRLRYQMNELGL